MADGVKREPGKEPVSVDMSRDIYRQLIEERQQASTQIAPKLAFPEWDILKELDRREKRKTKDTPTKRIRQYMRAHPEEVERIRREHGL